MPCTVWIQRQPGSHMRLSITTYGEYHITLPNHDPLRLATLAAILAGVALHHGLTRNELSQRLFD